MRLVQSNNGNMTPKRFLGKYGGTAAKRMVYEKFIGLDMGASRRPLLPFLNWKRQIIQRAGNDRVFQSYNTVAL